MFMGGLGFLLLLMGLGTFVVWVYALFDLLRRPEDEWRAAGQDRLLWALVVIFLSLIGAVLYLVIARPALERERVSAVA